MISWLLNVVGGLAVEKLLKWLAPLAAAWAGWRARKNKETRKTLKTIKTAREIDDEVDQMGDGERRSKLVRWMRDNDPNL